MFTNDEFLYQKLRAEFLSRHWAIGKYNRKNYFDNETYLGDFDRVNCCTINPSFPLTISGNQFYADPDGLRNLSDADLERWRIQFHDHTNGLLKTGERIISLMIEYKLGKRDSLKAVELTLQTVRSLFKFWNDGSPFEGYLVRWSPATTDKWTARFDENGKEVPVDCCDFLINPDHWYFNFQHFLYSTPLNDTRYLNTKQINAASPSPADRGYGDQYRRWEASFDEHVGLVSAYSMIWFILQNDQDETAVRIKDEVRRQCLKLAKYLQWCGYMLIRPRQNYNSRGASGMNVTFEYAFKMVFKRILGDSFYANGLDWPSASFSESIAKAGLWKDLVNDLLLYRTGIYGDIDSLDNSMFNLDLLLTTSADFTSLMRTFFTGNPATDLRSFTNVFGPIDPANPASYEMYARIALVFGYIYSHRDIFEMSSDDGKQDFAVGYLFKNIPVSAGFHFYMHTPNQGSSEEFKPYFGLMCLGDNDGSTLQLKEWYLEWYYSKWLITAVNPDLSVIDDLDANTHDFFTFATSVSLLLEDQKRKPPLIAIVENNFERMRNQLEGNHLSNLHLALNDEDNPICLSEKYDCKSGGGYILPLTLYWLDRRLNSPFPLNYLLPPNCISTCFWPKPLVKADIIRNTFASDDPDKNRLVLPINSLMENFIANPENLRDLDILENPPTIPDDNSLGEIVPPLNPEITQINETFPLLTDIPGLLASLAALTPMQLLDPTIVNPLLTKRVTIRIDKPDLDPGLINCYDLVASFTVLPDNINVFLSELRHLTDNTISYIEFDISMHTQLVAFANKLVDSPVNYTSAVVLSWMKKICGCIS